MAELWSTRRLIAVLARKDFYVRYRRTVLGLLWAVGLPVVQGIVLAVVFSHLVHTGRFAHGRSYAVFVFAALVPWTYFNATFSAAATSVADNAGLASRIYFPRAVLPIVTVISGCYALAITEGVLIVFTLVFRTGIGVRIFWLVPATALVVAVTAAFGLLVSGLHVYFRDLRYAVQAGLTVLFYLTPVIYPLSVAPRGLRGLVTALPVAGPSELFRAATVGAEGPWVAAVMWSLAWTVVVGTAGALVHSRRDRVFVDLL